LQPVDFCFLLKRYHFDLKKNNWPKWPDNRSKPDDLVKTQNPNFKPAVYEKYEFIYDFIKFLFFNSN
jgi:hypothetical protein